MKKERILTVIMTLAMAVSAIGMPATVFAVCEEGHTYGEITEYKAPTCTEAGNEAYAKCSECHEWFIVTYDDKDNNRENPIYTGCRENDWVINETGHSFTNYKSNDDATCTEDGTKTAKCDNCDVTDTITDEGSATGHSFTNYESNSNATCTEDGTKTAKCDNCDVTDTITDAGSATGHTYVVGEAKAPTCTEEGYTANVYCSICSENLLDRTDLPATGHSFTNYESNSNATCTEDGTKTAKCDNCNETDTITDAGSATGHNMTHHERVEATCTTAGNIEYWYCETEKKYFSDANGTTEITEAQTVIPATGHTYVIDEAKIPTCTETGLTEGSHCSQCSKILVSQKILSKTAHKLIIDKAKAPTCKKTGLTNGSHCKVCKTIIKKQKIVPALVNTIKISTSNNVKVTVKNKKIIVKFKRKSGRYRIKLYKNNKDYSTKVKQNYMKGNGKKKFKKYYKMPKKGQYRVEIYELNGMNAENFKDVNCIYLGYVTVK